MKKYCVYKHYADGKLFYIGSGIISRASNLKSRTEKWLSVYDSCESFAIEICKSFNDRDEALNLEGNMIDQLGPSVNCTIPGDCDGVNVFSEDYLGLPSNYADAISSLKEENDKLWSEIAELEGDDGDISEAIDQVEDFLNDAVIALAEAIKVMK